MDNHGMTPCAWIVATLMVVGLIWTLLSGGSTCYYSVAPGENCEHQGF